MDRMRELQRLEVVKNSIGDLDVANKIGEISFHCLNMLTWSISIVQRRGVDALEMVCSVSAGGEEGASTKETDRITVEQTGDNKLYLAPYSTNEVIYPIACPVVEGSVCKVYFEFDRIRFSMLGFDNNQPVIDVDQIFLVNETPLPLEIALSSAPMEVFQLPSCGAKMLPLYSMISLGGVKLGLVEGGKYVVNLSSKVAATEGGSLVTVTRNEEVVCEWPVVFA